MKAEQSKEVVQTFVQMVFGEKRVREGAECYMREDYVQHNPRGRDGREAFIQMFEGFFERAPDLSLDVKRALAEGDLVALHSHFKLSPGEKGSAVVDIFRIEDGLIAEHWDVVQAVPEEARDPGVVF